jgi:hypothetical protein
MLPVIGVHLFQTSYIVVQNVYYTNCCLVCVGVISINYVLDYEQGKREVNMQVGK